MSETDQELARDLGFLEAYTIGLGYLFSSFPDRPTAAAL